MDIPILSLLILIPLIGAIATLFMGGERQKYAKYVAGVFSAITLILSLYIMFATDMGELSESYAWIDTSYIVINFALEVDGLSILMVFLTALLTLLVVVFSAEEKDRPNYFHTLVMAMEVGLMGVYLAADYFLFYVMWEITLIPMYFMISWYGGPRRHYAAIKFLIYTHVASLVMLIGIFAMNQQSDAADLRGLPGDRLRPNVLRIHGQDAFSSLPHMAARRTRRGTHRRFRPSGRCHA